MDWFEARDFLLGVNEQVEDVRKGFLLARNSTHVDAVWLCSLFCDSPNCREHLLRILSRHVQTDVRAACFVGWLRRDLALLLWAAEQGHGVAQGLLCLNSHTRELWMERAAANGDVRGLFWKAESLKRSKEDLAIALYKEAAAGGLVCACISYGLQLSVTNEERYRLLVDAFSRTRIIAITAWKLFWERFKELLFFPCYNYCLTLKVSFMLLSIVVE